MICFNVSNILPVTSLVFAIIFGTVYNFTLQWFATVLKTLACYPNHRNGGGNKKAASWTETTTELVRFWGMQSDVNSSHKKLRKPNFSRKKDATVILTSKFSFRFLIFGIILDYTKTRKKRYRLPKCVNIWILLLPIGSKSILIQILPEKLNMLQILTQFLIYSFPALFDIFLSNLFAVSLYFITSHVSLNHSPQSLPSILYHFFRNGKRVFLNVGKFKKFLNLIAVRECWNIETFRNSVLSVWIIFA